MGRYIKPSVEIMKVETQASLLAGSDLNYTADPNEQNGVDLAPRYKAYEEDIASVNVWDDWDDETEDAEW